MENNHMSLRSSRNDYYIHIEILHNTFNAFKFQIFQQI